MKFMEEYLRICERVYIVSTTIHLDKGYEHMKELIKKKYQDEDVDIEDAQDLNRDLTLFQDKKMSEIDRLKARIAKLEREKAAS